MATHPALSPSVRDPRTIAPRDQIPNYNYEGPDPYIPAMTLPANTVCSECGAVYHNAHWHFDDKRRDTLLAAGANETVCPACKIISERNPQGIVYVGGDYWQQHREDMLNLIRNEERRAMENNPLERIIDIREENDGLIIETTSEKLAQHIGRAINGAHKGTLDYKWPDGNHLVRVYWERSLDTGKGK